MPHFLRILPLCLLLGGCLSPGETRLPGGTYRLQPSADAANLDEWQEVEVVWPEGHRKLLAHALNTPTKTRLTLMDPTTLATVAACTMENGRASLSGPAAMSDLAPELPLAVLQLAIWPQGSVQHGLSGGLRSTTLAGKRVIEDGETTLAEIETQADRSRIIRLPRYGTTIWIRPTPQP